MNLKIKTLFADLLGTPRTAEDVHFHAGPHAHPAVCFDARCGVPRLDV